MMLAHAKMREFWISTPRVVCLHFKKVGKHPYSIFSLSRYAQYGNGHTDSCIVLITRTTYSLPFTSFVYATVDSRGSQRRAVNIAAVTRTGRRDVFEGGDLKCIFDRCRAFTSSPPSFSLHRDSHFQTA